MQDKDYLEFTNKTMEYLYEVVDNSDFQDGRAAALIYDQLKNNLCPIPFCDYLKRYIARKADLDGDTADDEYRTIICESFRDTGTPHSFSQTSAKLSALVKNWLTQYSVNRNVILLLGFALKMSVEDVNEFLVKALHESELNAKDPAEILCWYCYRFGYSFEKFRSLWRRFTESDFQTEAGLYNEHTNRVKKILYSIKDDNSLMVYLANFRTSEGKVRFSVTTRETFFELYSRIQHTIAELYNQTE
ncbi:MAG: hypothetical protein E7672_03810, partial [Ruminococcaceae bacterium]|nr:hypothetical protein [Oscillospiraceae bacterium]